MAEWPFRMAIGKRRSHRCLVEDDDNRSQKMQYGILSASVGICCFDIAR